MRKSFRGDKPQITINFWKFMLKNCFWRLFAKVLILLFFFQCLNYLEQFPAGNFSVAKKFITYLFANIFMFKYAFKRRGRETKTEWVWKIYKLIENVWKGVTTSRLTLLFMNLDFLNREIVFIIVSWRFPHFRHFAAMIWWS